MFKLKPGNVFQKINKMDKKQAYTWGAIVVVCFVALLTLASFMGDADESSFDNFNTRGYDLAQMPFLNDEAEEYLLASKYPDMQGNNSTMLYSAAEKEARQEEDAAQAAEEASENTDETASNTEDSYAGGYNGGYAGGGYTGGGASGSPTQVGKLDNASVGRASGSGVSTSWGAPRGDFSPYKSQEKGSETPQVTQLRNQDARRALAQFAQTSRAAAGLKDSKGANAKRALMGGNVQGSEAFTERGVDLSKSGGLALDTNAPVSSADLSNLDKAVSDAANKGQKDKDDLEDDFLETMSDRLLEQLWSGMINMGLQAMGNLLNQGIDALQGSISGNSAANGFDNQTAEQILSKKWSELSPEEQDLYMKVTGRTAEQMTEVKGNLMEDFANYKKGLSGGNVKAVEKYSRPKEDYQSTFSRPTEDPELLALGFTEESEVVVDQKKYAAYKKDTQKWENDMRKEFASELKNNRRGSLSNTFYAQERANIYNTAYNAHQRSGNSKITTPEYGSTNTGSSSDNKEWWSKYGKDFGDSSKYDQQAVARCQGHKAPLTCLQSAKK